MNRHPDSLDSDEAAIDQLLHEVGARDLPAPEVMDEVRQAVHGEWRAMVEQRTRRKRFVGYGIAAGVAAVALAVTVSLQFMAARPAPVAAVIRVEGMLQVDPGGNGDWRALKAGEQVVVDGQYKLQPGSHVELTTPQPQKPAAPGKPPIGRSTKPAKS